MPPLKGEGDRRRRWRGSETGENQTLGQNPPASLRSAAPLSGGPLNAEVTPQAVEGFRNHDGFSSLQNPSFRFAHQPPFFSGAFFFNFLLFARP